MKHKTPLVFKIESELHARLDECAARTGIKKYTLGIMAIEAAVEAIEKNDFKLVVPIKFDVAEVPVPKTGDKTSYPSHRPQYTTAEEKPPRKKSAAG